MWFTTAMLAITFCQAADAPKTQPAATTPWQRVETMRRLLERKLGENAAAIGPQAPHPGSSAWGRDPLFGAGARSGGGGLADGTGGGAWPGGGLAGSDSNSDATVGAPGQAGDGAANSGPGVAAGDPNGRWAGVAGLYGASIADQFYGAQNRFDLTSHAEFVPELGAVVSLTVPVRCEWLAPEPGAPAAAKREPALPTDAEWEAAASGQQPPSQLAEFLAGRRGGADAAARRFKFADDALAALKRSVLETAWRFGGKLELGRGEKLAIVVQASPALDSNQALYGWQPGGFGDADSSPFGMAGGPASTNRPFNATGGPAATPEELFKQLAWRTGPIVPPAVKRLIVVISAEDLRAYRAGDVDQSELGAACRGDF